MGQVRRIIAVVAALAAVAFAVVWWRQSHALDEQGDATVWSPSASASGRASAGKSASATPAASSSPLPKGCLTTARPIEPTRFELERIGVDTPVLHVGLQDGAIGVPPLDDKTSVGWWTGGAKPGDKAGHAVLTTHTYHVGGALGNQLYSSEGLKAGDVLRLSDDQGRTLCYRYAGATKVWVRDYDPNSTVVVDESGAPRVVLVICWDWKASTREWDSRIVFNFDPMAA